jgi:hypothetical protein
LELGDGTLLCQFPGMSQFIALEPVSWQRMADGIDNVKKRLDRAAAALSAADVRYAVVCGNAVAA